MPNCAISGCFNHNRVKGEIEIKFYTFPKNEDLSKQWVRACCRGGKINLKNAVICSKHFERKYFFTSMKYRLLNQTPPKRFRNLQNDAIPTLFLPNTTTESRAVMELKPVAEDCSVKLNDLSTDVLENMRIKILSLEKEVEDLKLKNQELTNDKLNSDLKMFNFSITLGNHFTSGQIKRILNPKKRYLSWNSEDIASAISLWSVSPKAYVYLKKNGYPLPALSTLRKWAVNQIPS